MSINHPSERLTLSEFVATGRDVADIRQYVDTIEHDEPIPARIYAGEVFVEPLNDPAKLGLGPYVIEIANCNSFGELPIVELEGYAYYASERADDDVRAYLMDSAPTCNFNRIAKAEPDTLDSLTSIYNAFGAMYEYQLGSADEMAFAREDEAGKAFSDEHLKWLASFIERWEAVVQRTSA